MNRWKRFRAKMREPADKGDYALALLVLPAVIILSILMVMTASVASRRGDAATRDRLIDEGVSAALAKEADR